MIQIYGAGIAGTYLYHLFYPQRDLRLPYTTKEGSPTADVLEE
ncbi:hypothetical protein AFULGI_00007270 [Archaeoglobus fulgidus DSM 8774]|uniref:Uncharacterized protein n=1 Tax=Archaeoglobus fulgidus DSM 8774 TaxID=1344584 RepID=A0A075WD54_ARCFL|nr:hypothetical protein [Archaeoglobus fulgidus]AIG97527.1 hypothetical protein AFULGI_00007270 [Archaeoglobus fulgidus DSM 8774]